MDTYDTFCDTFIYVLLICVLYIDIKYFIVFLYGNTGLLARIKNLTHNDKGFKVSTADAALKTVDGYIRSKQHFNRH